MAFAVSLHAWCIGGAFVLLFPAKRRGSIWHLLHNDCADAVDVCLLWCEMVMLLVCEQTCVMDILFIMFKFFF